MVRSMTRVRSATAHFVVVCGLTFGGVACSSDSASSTDAVGGHSGAGGAAAAGSANVGGGGGGASGNVNSVGGAAAGLGGSGGSGAATAGTGTGGDEFAGGASGSSAGGSVSPGGGSSVDPDCRDGTYQGKTYHVCVHAGLDRPAARAFCQARAADLIELNDADEETWAYEFVTESGSIWIGASDTDLEGDWRWADGTVLSGGYTSWAEGQPNNSGAGEDCAVLHSGMGEWNDVACDLSIFGTDPISVLCEP